ncbi:hypothetical protein B8V81_4454 [Paenibacillus pasadenensis]|uniref:Uncharacterized protein n=1 Tax=Paenibacillus pasadenensis TaxID=217090 RepID=A0A2N5N6T4_9BACL|nr:hypothetical protein B8V81_4454 [Paenibacillus pasadenensis]
MDAFEHDIKSFPGPSCCSIIAEPPPRGQPCPCQDKQPKNRGFPAAAKASGQ